MFKTHCVPDDLHTHLSQTVISVEEGKTSRSHFIGGETKAQKAK